MEMLYRLSYVGFDDRDVQVGSTARATGSVGVLLRIVTTWLSVLGSKDALPRGDFLFAKVVGKSCEHRNLSTTGTGVNGKSRKFPVLGIWAFRTGATPWDGPGRGEDLERETGFEPATLSLEG